MSGSPAPSRAARPLVALLLAVVALQGVFFALYLVPWEDESGYLVLGALATRGEIRLYADEMLGERLPLPFYVLGITQAAGPNLLAARLVSLLLGLAGVALVYEIGRKLGGEGAGTLAALFLATHAVVIGYYATAMYHAMSSLVILAGLYLILVRRSPLAGMAAFSLLSLTRPNLAVAVPFVLAFLVWRAPDRRTRVWLVVIAFLPPLAFFASSPEHLKLLAYVPVVRHLVAPLDYVSLFRLGGDALTREASWAAGLAWFARRYAVWWAAGLGLVAIAALARARGSTGTAPGPDGTRFIAWLAVYLLAWQCVILAGYPKSVQAWTASFASLGALLLGYHASRLLVDTRLPALGRPALVAGLVGVFALGPTLSTHANQPRPLPAEATTIGLLERSAAELRSMIPPGSRVFLVGMSVLPYLAGSRPYAQQIIHSWTLVPRGEPEVLRRSGLWGRKEIERWLGAEARFAIIQPDRLDAWRAIDTYRPLAERIEALLASQFRLVVELDTYPLGHYRVYERREPRSARTGSERT